MQRAALHGGAVRGRVSRGSVPGRAPEVRPVWAGLHRLTPPPGSSGEAPQRGEVISSSALEPTEQVAAPINQIPADRSPQRHPAGN